MHPNSAYSKASVHTEAFFAPCAPALLPWQYAVLGWLCGIWATRYPAPALLVLAALLGFAWLSCSHGVSVSHPALPPSPARPRIGLACFILAATLLGLFAGSGESGWSRPQWGKILQPEMSTILPASDAGHTDHTDAAVSPPIPDFMTQRQPVFLNGTVARVETAVQERVRVFLRDVRVTIPHADHGTGTVDSSAEITPLPGYVVWTWDHPAQVPGLDDTTRIGPGQRITLHQRIKPVHGFLNPGTWDSGEYWRDRGAYWRIWSRGDRYGLQVRGTPDTVWQLREALRQGVMHALTGAAQDGTHKTAQSAIPSGTPQSIVPALLFGDRFFLSYARMDQLALAGLSHSLALSGMHLGIMSSLGWGLAWLLGMLRPELYLRLPRPKLAVLCAAPFVCGYVWLGGASPSLLRAAIMFACWGVLLWRNRPRVLLDGLFLAVLVITLHTPLSLFDLRLQLSALAVLSLALFMPFAMPLVRAVQHRVLPAPPSPHTAKVRTLAAKTLRAALTLLAANLVINIGMLPVVLWNFNNIGSWFWLNLLWLPVLGLWVLPACFAGLAAVLAGLLLPAASPWATHTAHVLFACATAPAAALFSLLDALQAADWLIPLPALRPHWCTIAGYWCALGGLLLLARRRWHSSIPASVGLPSMTDGIVLGLGVLLLLTPPAQRLLDPRHTVTLTLIDVGQGQSVLLTLPPAPDPVGYQRSPAYAAAHSGTTSPVTASVLPSASRLLPHARRILVDGGGFGLNSFDTGRGIVTPVLTRNMPPELDMIINTHPDTDHLQGLFHPLRYCSVDCFAGNGQQGSTTNEEALRTILKRTGTPVVTLAAGDILELGNGLSLEVLHPPRHAHASSNNAALVLRLVRNGQGLALLTGDVEKEGIRQMLETGCDLRAQILVLPHHGAASSLVPELYDAVHPAVALAATGYLNQWDFPSPCVRQALQERNIRLLHTALNGQVRVRWDTASDGAIVLQPQVEVAVP